MSNAKLSLGYNARVTLAINGHLLSWDIGPFVRRSVRSRKWGFCWEAAAVHFGPWTRIEVHAAIFVA